MRLLRTTLIALATVGISSQAAHALSGPETDIAYYDASGNPAVLSSTNFGTSSFADGTAIVSGSPGGAVFASVPNQPTSTEAFEADASLYYLFQVNAPTNFIVPIQIAYKVSATGPSASADIDTTIGQAFFGSSGGSSGGYCSAITSCTGNVMSGPIQTNFYGYVELGAISYGGTAFADPLIQIDPTWAAANPGLASQLTITLTEGVVNGYGQITGGVPEPATWTIMTMGLCMVGGGLRARARRAAAI